MWIAPAPSSTHKAPVCKSSTLVDERDYIGGSQMSEQHVSGLASVIYEASQPQPSVCSRDAATTLLTVNRGSPWETAECSLGKINPVAQLRLSLRCVQCPPASVAVVLPVPTGAAGSAPGAAGHTCTPRSL
ncbi:unnamed protein product [Pleuronectes platessa]|uniref:Uncharacterized protein n=1 Tax=Pleuronectes platessa TaxID=8262 RepID=A0A9N7VYE3_PLEPL|nr:unnamed protein product [Pleuronectes platessa]